MCCNCMSVDFVVYISGYVGLYRSHVNVGRILYRVATLRNIAKDLLCSLMIKNLIEYI